MQHFLKAASRTAKTEVVTTELFYKLLVAVDDSMTAFDLRFGGESLAALTAARERKTDWRVRLGISWHASLVGDLILPRFRCYLRRVTELFFSQEETYAAAATHATRFGSWA